MGVRSGLACLVCRLSECPRAGQCLWTLEHRNVSVPQQRGPVNGQTLHHLSRPLVGSGRPVRAIPSTGHCRAPDRIAIARTWPFLTSQAHPGNRVPGADGVLKSETLPLELWTFEPSGISWPVQLVVLSQGRISHMMPTGCPSTLCWRRVPMWSRA